MAITSSKLVGRQDDNPVAGHPRQHLTEAQPLLRVQAGRGLVEHQELGFPKQCLSQSQAPPHPA